MTKITIHHNKGLDRQHEDNLEYFREKNQKPTGLRRRPSDNAQSAYDAQGRHEAADWDGLMGTKAHGKGKR